MNDWSTFADSPYDGVAVRLQSAYDPRPLNYDKLLIELKKVCSETGKDPWPWVFMNRMIGLKEGSEKQKILRQDFRDYFMKIRGMDIFNNSGALEGFMDNWKKSLALARETGAPGVIIDLEAYNDYSVYDMVELSKCLDKGPAEVEAGLRLVGARMADIAADEYPEALVWTLFAGLGKQYKGSGRLYSVGYIVLGFLERCKEKKYTMKVVAGGELQLGYCSTSLDGLKTKISSRQKAYSAWLLVFQNNLVLGGTIGPWDKPEEKNGWQTLGECRKSTMKSLDDFRPCFRELAVTYSYVWIYTDKSGAYDPFDKAKASRFNQVIEDAFKGNRKRDYGSGRP